MPQILTFGETMVCFIPNTEGPLRYADSFVMRPAGAESNTAIGLARLGHTAGYITRFGNDEFGRYLTQQLRGEGLDLSNTIIDNQAPTGLMFKEFLGGGQTAVTYYRKSSAASKMSPSDITEKTFDGVKVLHLTGITPALSKSCHEVVLHAIDLAKKCGVKVSFDPNIRLKLWSADDARRALLPVLPKCDMVFLGTGEAEILFNTADTDQIIDNLLELGVLQVGLKMGENGAIVADKNVRQFIPAYPVTLVDSTGAGDAFNAGFLSAMIEGEDLITCGKIGCAMGAYAVTSIGDYNSLPNKEQLKAFMNNEKIKLR